MFHNFQALVEQKFDSKIIAMQSDWGGEYEKLNSFFQKIGIYHHVSCPHAHQQNGFAERKHCHIVEVGLALLASASMPLKFWDEAFLTVVHLINMWPSRTIANETPTERLLHITPDYTTHMFSVESVGQTFVPTTLVNLCFDLNNVSFSVIVHNINVSSVLTCPPVVCTFLVMLCLMKPISIC